MATKAPDIVTITGASAVLQTYAQQLLKGLGRDPRMAKPWTVRMVRHMANAVSRPIHAPDGHGDSLLLDAVEVAFLAVIVEIREAELTGGLMLWSGVATHADAIRAGLAVPARRQAVVVRLGRIGVMTLREADALWHSDPDVAVIDLAGVRRCVDALIAERRAAQPWEYVNWRRQPARQVARELAGQPT